MNENQDFFIGWSGRLPRAHRRFVPMVAAFALVTFALLGLGLSATVDDPGDGDVNWGEEVRLEGRLTALPYPLLHLPDGHTVMMSGFGKSGVEIDPSLDGKAVKISGYMAKRGALDMLQSSADLLTLGEAPAALAKPPVALGKWRLTGEICDGKCYAGVMRPGTGLAHKACASFCVLGGVPPVFVTTNPVAGSQFLLIAGPGAEPMPASLRDLIGLRVSIEGAIERDGDLLIFHADPASVRAL